LLSNSFLKRQNVIQSKDEETSLERHLEISQLLVLAPVGAVASWRIGW
jgi:hypothetical protein